MRELLGNLHPAIVQFPVAFLLSGSVIELAHAARGKRGRSTLARQLLLLGAITTVLAGISGLARFHPDEFTDADFAVFMIHRLAAFATLAVVWITVLAGRSVTGGRNQRQAWIYRTLYVVTGLLTLITGHYGGWLVFGWGPIWTF